MAHDPYAPKRGGNPAAEIVDLKTKPLAWLRRNPQPHGPDLVPMPFPDAQERERLAAIERDLANYIDSTNQQEAAVQPRQQDIIEMVEPLLGIAKLIPEMSHREFKEWVGTAVLGVDMAKLTEEDRRRIWETCDRVEMWAAGKLDAANNPRAAA